MRAKNDEQREVERLHGLLPALTMRQLNWIAGQDCERGAEEYAKTRKMATSYDYYTIVTSFRGWQVTRYFLIHSKTTRNGYGLEYIVEVSQRWMKIGEYGQLHLHIFEKQKMMCWQWKNQPYSLGAPLTLKNWDAGYNRGGRTQFSMADFEIYPIRRFSKGFKEAGLDKAAGRIDEICLYRDRGEVDSIKSLRLSKRGLKKATKKCYLPSICETLFKIGEPGLALECVSGGFYQSLLKRYWRSFLIARRHGLKNTDWHLWLDYVRDLDGIGRDIHSPKYLVPEDIGRAHGRVLERLRQMRTELMAEKERMSIREQEAAYNKRMHAYFGLAIVTKSGITITPLQSVQAFYDEGTAMHHCVYSLGYYKRSDCLILSARDKNGNRVETIEINLNTMTIAQSRGVCNKTTAFHDEIVKAMKRNMWQVRNIANAA